MSLGRRWGLAERSWYGPTSLLLVTFAIGVQFVLITQALGGEGYPPLGLGWLAFLSLAVIVATVVLNLSLPTFNAPDTKVIGERARQALKPMKLRTRRVAVLSRMDDDEEVEPTPTPSAQALPGERLSVRVHSPLANGPVVAPGEPIPITIEASPASLASELEVHLGVDENGKRRESRMAMEGENAVVTETMQEPGPFTLTIRITHPRGDPAKKTIEGRVGSYREEIGRLFDAVKSQAAGLGLPVAKHSTPREVVRALEANRAAPRDRLERLRTELERALYDDDPVGRDVYETVYVILGREVRLRPQGPAEVQP